MELALDSELGLRAGFVATKVRPTTLMSRFVGMLSKTLKVLVFWANNFDVSLRWEEGGHPNRAKACS
eukprot:6491413-Amphidinium_carterae.3